MTQAAALPPLIRAQVVDLVLIDEGEKEAIRHYLEALRIGVRMLPIGTPAQLAELLAGKYSLAPFLVLIGHGDERGFLLPELASDLAAAQPFNEVLTAAEVRRHGNLAGQVVISGACATGSEAMSRAFLEANAEAYIAPAGYPDAEEAVRLITELFYSHIYKERPLPEALALAAQCDREPLSGDFRGWFA